MLVVGSCTSLQPCPDAVWRSGGGVVVKWWWSGGGLVLSGSCQEVRNLLGCVIYFKICVPFRVLDAVR